MLLRAIVAAICGVTRCWRIRYSQARAGSLLRCCGWGPSSGFRLVRPKLSGGAWAIGARWVTKTSQSVLVLLVVCSMSARVSAQVPRMEPQEGVIGNVGRFVIGRDGALRRGRVELVGQGGAHKLVVGLVKSGDGQQGVGGTVDLAPEHRIVHCLWGPGIVVSGSSSGRSFLDAVDFANGPSFRRVHEEEGEGELVVLDYNQRERALYLLSHARHQIVRLPLQGAYPLSVKAAEVVQRLAMPQAWTPGMGVELRSYSWPEPVFGCAEGGYLIMRDSRRCPVLAWRLSRGDSGLHLDRIPLSDLDYIPEGSWRLRLEAGPQGGLAVDGDLPRSSHLVRWRSYGLPDTQLGASERVESFRLAGTRPIVVLDGEALEQYRGRWLSVEGVSLSASRPVYVPWQFGGDVNSELLRLHFEAVPFAHPYPDCARYQVAFRLAPDHRAKEQPLAFLLIAAIVKLDGVGPERVRSVLREGGASAAFAPPGAFEYSGAWFDIKVPADARVGEHIACQVHALQVRGGSYEHIASSEVVAAEIVSPRPKGSVLKEQEIGVGLSLSTPMEAQMRDLLAMLRWR